LTRRRAEKHGRTGERIAAWWLRLHGWHILGERVKTPRGEIDLVARRWRTLAFVEVKMRTTEAALATAIDDFRLRRVVAAAEALLPRYGAGATDIRIDVMLIRPWRLPVHMKNVWHG
jgi:putative endonuclease